MSKSARARAREPVEERTPSIEYSLLGLLGEKPMHGYELYRELGRKSGLGLVWTVKQAQLYAILARLETVGLISSELVASAQGPARKVFHLTAEGRAAFAEWVREPASRRDFRLDFLAKLLFAEKKGCRAATALVSEQRRLCGQWLEEMRARSAACEKGSLDALVYRFRVGQLASMASWLDECAAYVGASETGARTKTNTSAKTKTRKRASSSRKER